MPLCPGGWLTCDEWMTLSMWKQKWSNHCMSRRADVVDIVSIDQYFVLFSFQTHNGSCIILLSTEEGHVTSSDQRNMGRSSNCPFLAEAEKKPVEKFPVSLLCYHKGQWSVPLSTWARGWSQSPPVSAWTSQLSRTMHLCCEKRWDLRVLLLLQNLKLL